MTGIRILKHSFRLCLGILALAAGLHAHAEAMRDINQVQSLDLVKKKVEEFLSVQTTGYPGKVSFTVGGIDNNLKLSKCNTLEAFMPQGSRAWGKTNVGVRCSSPSWTIYVQANVSVVSQYLVAAAPLAQGRVVTSDDILFENGDLAQLPAGIFTTPEQAIGRTVNISMGAGTVLRQEMLKAAPVIQQGQTVMLLANGKGFSISAEGKALTNANEGQLARAQVAGGQVVTGIARNGGRIDVGF